MDSTTPTKRAMRRMELTPTRRSTRLSIGSPYSPLNKAGLNEKQNALESIGNSLATTLDSTTPTKGVKRKMDVTPGRRSSRLSMGVPNSPLANKENKHVENQENDTQVASIFRDTKTFGLKSMNNTKKPTR